MIQYLFPALSLRKGGNEGLSPDQLAMTGSWDATILGVAVEEMGHLGTVCNLLAAIGDGPRFERQVRKARGVIVAVRDALRQAGAEAGRRARREVGLPEQVEDH
jgi:hypothetical protein